MSHTPSTEELIRTALDNGFGIVFKFNDGTYFAVGWYCNNSPDRCTYSGEFLTYEGAINYAGYCHNLIQESVEYINDHKGVYVDTFFVGDLSPLNRADGINRKLYRKSDEEPTSCMYFNTGVMKDYTPIKPQKQRHPKHIADAIELLQKEGMIQDGKVITNL